MAMCTEDRKIVVERVNRAWFWTVGQLYEWKREKEEHLFGLTGYFMPLTNVQNIRRSD